MKLTKITFVFFLSTVLITLSACGPKENPLIEKLGARKFNEREQAQKEILQNGASYIDTLFKYKDHNDLEIRKRIQTIIPMIFKGVSEIQGKELQKKLDLIKKNRGKEFNEYLYDRLKKLLELNKDNDKDERENVIKILIRCDKENATATLFNYFKEGKLSFTTEEEKYIYNDASVTHLVEILKNKNGLNKKVITSAMQYLGAIFTPKAQRALMGIIKDPNLTSDLRLSALNQMGKVINFLYEELDDVMVPAVKKRENKKRLSDLKKELTDFIESKNDKEVKEAAEPILKKIKD